MSYDSAVAQLYELGHELARTPSHKFDLAHMRVLLEALGSPERRLRAVLIAGTNGKGSTAATLASILTAAGHRTGLYTSPHLVRINERIRINGEAISDADFTRVHDEVERVAARLIDEGRLPWHPSFFEVLTAMAFVYFAECNNTGQRPVPHNPIDIAVLEVGMGGRLDATNVVEPLVSVIADVSLDHQKFLGDTVREIAGEKAGIIRRRGTVVTLPQHPQANDVIGRAILECEARGVNAAEYVPPVTEKSPVVSRRLSAGSTPIEPYSLEVMGEEIEVESPLGGRHQLRNIALAIAAAVELNAAGVRVTAGDIERGVRETRWPGRFQVVRQDGVEFVLDVAHNPAGAWALRSALSQRFEGRPLVFVFGAMRDKAVQEMAEILFPTAERVIATRAENPRSATPEQIAEAAARTGAEIEVSATVKSAIEMARRYGAVVVITGSIYVVGEAMQALGISAG